MEILCSRGQKGNASRNDITCAKQVSQICTFIYCMYVMILHNSMNQIQFYRQTELSNLLHKLIFLMKKSKNLQSRALAYLCIHTKK